MMIFLLIVLGVSVWLAVMIMTIALPVNPKILLITKNFVCPPDAEMKVETYSDSYHQPGVRSLSVYCRGPDGNQQSVKGKALLALLGLCFGAALPVTSLIVWLVYIWLGY